MKILLSVASLVLASFAGFQSLQIAQAGAANQIPQLEGDGGGGMAFAVLLFLSGLILLWKPLWAAFAFAVSAIVILSVGLIYQDNVMLWWTAAPVLLGGLGLFAHFRKKRAAQTARSNSPSTRHKKPHPRPARASHVHKA